MRKVLLLLTLLALVPNLASASDWPTYHGDNTRQGNDGGDPGLATPVQAWTSSQLDGNVYGSPVVVGSQVIVATENNTVYSLDPSTGTVQWRVNVGSPRTSNFPCGNINPLGITGTPAVDGASVFVVAEIQTSPTSFRFDLDTLDLATGNVSRRVDITPAGMDVNTQQERGALLVTNGRVFVPIGGLNGDCGNYHGYVLSYPESGLGALQSFTVGSGNNRGGIWATGGPSAADATSVYASTGNSTDLNANAYDYSDGVVKLSSTTTQVTDFFAPSTWTADNARDADLGSTTPLQLPNNRVFIVGKSGIGYLLNSAAMGGIGHPLAQHQVCHATSDAAFGSLAYTGGVAYVPCNDGLTAVTIAAGGNDFLGGWYNTTDVATHPPTIAGGLVWAIDPAGANLLGFNLATGQRVQTFGIGGSTHFATPSAANGQLYVAANSFVFAYAAFPQPPLNGVTLDGFGGVHHFGSVASPTGGGPFWPNFFIGRAVSLRANHTGGYVLDGWGGVHPFGGAAGVAVSFYQPGWDIARAMVLRSDGVSGYVLDGWGGVHPFGTAPSVAVTFYQQGWDIARGLVLRSDGVSGYVLDGWGGLHPFGGAPSPTGASFYQPGWDIAHALTLRDDGSGYVLDGWGGIHHFGGAPAVAASGYWQGWDIARGIAMSNSSPASGYVLDGWGGLHEFGAAGRAAAAYTPGRDIFRGISITA